MKKLFLSITMVSFGIIYSQVGINTPNPRAVLHVDGAKDNPSLGIPTAIQQGNDFVVSSDGSVGIGTTTPNASAILDITSSNKGLLAPRLALSSSTDRTTIPSPATGLIVYNTGTGGLNYVGYVFWNGDEWRSLQNATIKLGTVDAITCNDITLSPSTYTSGTPYVGTLNVPYTGGDGGYYASQSIGPINGLTATLSSGNFNSGNGTLSYKVTGIPTVTSPTTTIFPLVIGGKSCSAVLGGGSQIAPGDIVYYHASIPRRTSNYVLSDVLSDLPLLAGTFRVDALIIAPNAYDQTGTDTNYAPRIYNQSSTNQKLWVTEISTHTGDSHGGNLFISPTTSSTTGYAQFDDGVYLTQGRNETVTFDITTEDYKWFRVYYVIRVDNKYKSGSPNSGEAGFSGDNNVLDNTLEVYISVQRLY